MDKETVWKRCLGIIREMVRNFSRSYNRFDLENHIDTGAFVNKENLYDTIMSSNKVHMNRYEPVNVKRLGEIFDKLLDIDRTILNSAFIDFGCGKGRALIVAERFGFKNVIGVEFAKKLCDICENNLERAGCSRSCVICEDAVEYKLFGEIRVFYFFNPFVFWRRFWLI